MLDALARGPKCYCQLLEATPFLPQASSHLMFSFPKAEVTDIFSSQTVNSLGFAGYLVCYTYSPLL